MSPIYIHKLWCDVHSQLTLLGPCPEQLGAKRISKLKALLPSTSAKHRGNTISNVASFLALYGESASHIGLVQQVYG